MPLSHLDTAFDRNTLCNKIEPLLNYDEKLNSALILINVWHTRQISAHHGYDISQELLGLITQDIQKFVKKNCCLLRTGNHEFALLIQNIKNPGHCQLALNKLTRDLHNKSLSIKNFATKTKITVGAALYPRHAATVQNLVQFVEVAINQAEEKNIPGVLYTYAMSERIIRQLKLETALDLAIQRQELELWYQPKIDIKTGAIYGVEALTRWHTKEGGFIAPDIFIPLAEKRGFVFDLTRWALNIAFRKQTEWAGMGLDINMAVNISGKVIDYDEFVDLIEHSRGIWETPANMVTLEITETAMMNSFKKSLDKLNTLRDMGFILSIDDFGTGYSSLEYFKILPVHEVKIDKSFVQNMMTNKEDKNLVKMMISLAKSIGLNLVAEGIEDSKTLEELKKLGVDRIQGYYYAKPMPEDEFLTWAEYYLANLEKGNPYL